MDPVTLITTALAAGAAAAAKNGISEAVKDGYAALKRRIIERFGTKADVASAIGQVEQKPNSTARQSVLDEEVRLSGAHEDADLAGEAQALLTPHFSDSVI